MRDSTARSLPASFRDPAGFVFRAGSEVRRAVTAIGAPGYECLMSSGLGAELMRDRLLIPHEQAPGRPEGWPEIQFELRPEQLEFVSYPYEWCSSQLKDAALLTLEIQRRALAKGMTLKDASAFNVQFQRGRPIFIDTLSFERDEGGPWVAYEQFCRQFLAPLLLMKAISPDIGRLLSADLSGIMLDAASRMLGWRTYLNAGALLHVHLHAKAIGGQARAGLAPRVRAGRGTAMQIMESLRQTVEGVTLADSETIWSEYERQSAHYSVEAHEAKSLFVGRVLDQTPRGLVYDVGGNTGQYSRMAAAAGHFCVLYDADIECVERAYRQGKETQASRILPLRLDVSNPTPALGVNLSERSSLFERPRAELVVALALVHHLRLRENIPFGLMAEFFSKLGRRLLVEWVGPDDEMARAMLMGKRTRPQEYTVSAFLEGFSRHYRLIEQALVVGMDRTLLVMECTDSSNT